MSELLPAAQCCCGPESFSGLTWFECKPLVEPALFLNGFRIYGVESPRFLVLVSYEAVPGDGDYVFYGSLGQFWILKDPVCSIQEYIDEGGTYINPPQESGPLSQGSDEEFWGCGFRYPENLIVKPYTNPGGIPSTNTYDVSGTTVTSPYSGSSASEFGPYANGNLIGETSAWRQTGYFFPGMNELESEFLDITLVQPNSGRTYLKRFTPAAQIWTRTGDQGEEPSGIALNNPHVSKWYSLKRYVRERGNFQFGMESHNGLQGVVVCTYGYQSYDGPFGQSSCCGHEDTIGWECNTTAQGTWTGSPSGASASGTGGTICPLDGVNNNVSDSVSLTIRGTQTVQVDGPPTELAVPQNGMGDQPRLLDPFILSKFFLYGTKLNIFECFPPETPCDDCNFSVGVVGPAKREWRISAKQLFGESGTLYASDSALAQVQYTLSGGQVVARDQTIFLNQPEITNSHSPVDGLLLAQIQWAVYDAANPGQIFQQGCTYSSGDIATKRIGTPCPCPPGDGCPLENPWSPNFTIGGFGISDISVSY